MFLEPEGDDATKEVQPRVQDRDGEAGAGFALFLAPSLLWSVVGWVHREASLVVLHGAFTVINLLGIYRWATF